MKHISLGGLDVSRIGLGTMAMSGYYLDPDSSDTESIRTIQRASELGVTLIDTAEIYGPYVNEELVGRALKGRRDQVVVATKFGLVSHSAWADVTRERLLGRHGESALSADPADRLKPPRPELFDGLLIARRNVPWRVHPDRSGGLSQPVEGLLEEPGEGREPRRWPADDREHQVEAVPGGADDGLGAAADPNPRRKRPEFEMGHDVLVDKRTASLALPGDRPALEQLGEQAGLLLEQLVVVVQAVAEQGERVDTRTASKDHLCAAA
jgi:hypothetical protein